MLLIILRGWPTRQVEDHANFRVSRVCTHIRFFELETFRSFQMFNVLEDSGREVVQTDDSRSYVCEYVADPAAEKPGPARYQNTLPAKRFRVNRLLDLFDVFLDDRVHQSYYRTS